MSEQKILDVSWGTISKFVLIFLFFYLLYLTKEILVWIIFALIISILFSPAINFLHLKRIPRPLAAIFIYFAIFGFIGFLVYLTTPLLSQEIQQFLTTFPKYFDKFSPPLRALGITTFESFEAFTKGLQNWLVGASSNIFSAIVSIFGGISSAFSILTIAILFSFEENAVEKTLKLLFPVRHREYAISIWRKSEAKISGWFGTRVISCIFVGILSYISFLFLGIRYPFIIASLAGILEFIPIIGPIFAGALVFLVALPDLLSKALFGLAAFILIQVIEGNLLTPILAKKFVGLPPVLVFISLLIGGELWGVLGAILAIPLAGVLFEFFKEFLARKREQETEKAEV